METTNSNNPVDGKEQNLDTDKAQNIISVNDEKKLNSDSENVPVKTTLVEDRLTITVTSHSSPIDAEALLEQIKNDSYKWEYLGFWECLWSSIKDFINHLFGYESHYALTCFIEKIIIDEKAIEFITLALEKLPEKLNSELKMALQETYFLQKMVDKNKITSMTNEDRANLTRIMNMLNIFSTVEIVKLARDVFDEIYTLQSKNQDKENLENFFGDAIMKEMRKNDNLKWAIQNNLPNHQDPEENKKRMEFLEFLSTKCGNDPSLNITFSSYLSNIKNCITENEHFNNIIKSIISNSKDMIDKESAKVDKDEIPSKAYQELLNNIYLVAPDETINKNDTELPSIRELYLKGFQLANKILDDGIKILRKNELPEKSEFWKTLENVNFDGSSKTEENCETKFDLDPKETRNLIFEYYVYNKIENFKSSPGYDFLKRISSNIWHYLEIKKDSEPIIAKKDLEDKVLPKIKKSTNDAVIKVIKSKLKENSENPEEKQKWQDWENTWNKAKNSQEQNITFQNIKEIDNRFDAEVQEQFFQLFEESNPLQDTGIKLESDDFSIYEKDGKIQAEVKPDKSFFVRCRAIIEYSMCLSDMVLWSCLTKGEALPPEDVFSNLSDRMGNAYIEHLQKTNQLPPEETQQ